MIQSLLMKESDLITFYTSIITAAVLLVSLILGLEPNPLITILIVAGGVIAFLRPIHRTFERLFSAFLSALERSALRF